MSPRARLRAWLAPCAAALLAFVAAPAVAQTAPAVSVGTITSEKACSVYQTVWAARYVWGTALVRDCVDNFRGFREQIESALASSGRLAVQPRGGLVVSGRISELGSSATAIGQGGSATGSAAAVVSMQVSVKDAGGRVVWGGLITKRLETGAAAEADGMAMAGGQDGRTVYTQLQHQMALAVARAVTFKLAPLHVTGVQGKRILLDAGEPLLTLGAMVQATSSDGMSTVKYLVTSATDSTATAELYGGDDYRRIAPGSLAIAVEGDSPAANSRRYSRVGLGDEDDDDSAPMQVAAAPARQPAPQPAYVPPPPPPPVQVAQASSPDRSAGPAHAAKAAASLVPAGAGSEPRLALVVGNSAYGGEIGALANPVRDAALVGEALRRVGFDVVVVTDADQKALKRAISQFGERLGRAGRGATGLFYYAGHGMQTQGVNYLIPVGAAIKNEADIDLEAVSADTVVTQMANAGTLTSIVVLDACRNMPVQRSFRSATRGLARMEAPNGSFVAYSTAPGSTAVDGNGANSPFATALASEITAPGETIEVAFRNVRKKVLAATGNQQTPWDSSSLVDSFQFTR